MKKGKVIVISAPSGTGKSTIIKAIMDRGNVDMRFSVSATSRPPRDGEIDGVHYHFISEDRFRELINDNQFVEYEEVYNGRFYGTLRSEIQKNIDNGHNVVLDIDVKGALNVIRQFGDNAVSIFIMPPSVEELKNRLVARATDTPEVIAERVAKAEYEISFANRYNNIVVNDNLDDAVISTEKIIADFTN